MQPRRACLSLLGRQSRLQLGPSSVSGSALLKLASAAMVDIAAEMPSSIRRPTGSSSQSGSQSSSSRSCCTAAAAPAPTTSATRRQQQQQPPWQMLSSSRSQPLCHSAFGLKRGCASEAGEDDAAKAAAIAAAKKEREKTRRESAKVLMDSPVDGAGTPSSWRNAQERVDLEFLSQGLDPEAEGQRSTWGDEGVPPHNVLWPQPALEEHRSRPFGPDLKGELSPQQISANQQRLEDLWRLSASHGISWDELDRAYVEFAKKGSERMEAWSNVPSQRRAQPSDNARGSRGYSGYSGGPPRQAASGPTSRQDKPKEYWEKPLAWAMKVEAKERAVKHLQKFMPNKDPWLVAPSQTKRLAGKIFAKEKKKYFAPWKPGMLTRQLQQLVAASMLRRETAERCYKSNK